MKSEQSSRITVRVFRVYRNVEILHFIPFRRCSSHRIFTTPSEPNTYEVVAKHFVPKLEHSKILAPMSDIGLLYGIKSS